MSQEVSFEHHEQGTEEDFIIVPFFENVYVQLLTSGGSALYYGLELFLSEKRLIMDYGTKDSPKYTGGLIDSISKIYQEEGLLGVLGRREWVPTLLSIASSASYYFLVGNRFVHPLRTRQTSLLPKLLINISESALVAAFTYPISTATLISFRRDDNEELTKKNKAGVFPVLAQTVEENGVVNGLFRGMYWWMIYNVAEQAVKQVASLAYEKAISSLIGLDMGAYNVPYEQYDAYESIGDVIVDFVSTAVLSPLRFSITRYQGDQGRRYNSVMECMKRVHNEEGFKTFYKGTIIGMMLAKKK